MALPATKMQVSMAQPDTAPLGGVKWKPLYDNDNPFSNKILFCNTHTSELMEWHGFNRQRGKDYMYTCIPFTSEQHETIIKTVETQVSHILSQHEWSRSFKLIPTQKIFPKSEYCLFYEKRDDQLHRTHPDIEELRNTPEKSLSIGALLQAAGVYFDFVTHVAKLTFKLVSATYAWSDTEEVREELVANYLSVFGRIASEERSLLQQQQQQKKKKKTMAPPAPPPPLASQVQQQASAMDIVEVAATVSGISTMQTPETPPPLDKESFLASLSKLRTVGGIQRKMKQLQKRQMDDNLREWCDREATRVMFALSAKDAQKRQHKADEEEVAIAAKKVKPFTLQRQNNLNNFKVLLDDADTLGCIISTDDDEDEEMDEEDVIE